MLRLFKTPLYVQSIIAMLLGFTWGLIGNVPPAFAVAVTKIIMQLIIAGATPLLFFAILESVLSGNLRLSGVRSWLSVVSINAFCAFLIAFGLFHFLKPGQYIALHDGTAKGAAKKWDWSQGLAGYFPESFLAPFVSNAIPSVILVALFLGAGVNAVIKRHRDTFATEIEALQRWVNFAFHLSIQLMGWLVHLVPLAILFSIAKLVATQGSSAFGGLFIYSFIAIGGMLLQIGIVYQGWIAVIAGVPLRRFWRAAKEAVIHAFGINSSLASLPFTLKVLDELKVSPASARMSALVGTNFNNDGILLYEVFAAFTVSQAAGISMSFTDQLWTCVVCVVATIGVAGIPEAGIISLALVLSTLHLPAEYVPLLLTVDWLAARMRSVTNVTSDMTVAIAMDAIGNKFKRVRHPVMQ